MTISSEPQKFKITKPSSMKCCSIKAEKNTKFTKDRLKSCHLTSFNEDELIDSCNRFEMAKARHYRKKEDNKGKIYDIISFNLKKTYK